jgi:hypothetical protein
MKGIVIMNKLPYVKKIIISGDDIEDLLRENFSDPSDSIGDLLYPMDYYNGSCRFYPLDGEFCSFEKDENRKKQQEFIFKTLKEQFPEEDYVLIDVSW